MWCLSVRRFSSYAPNVSNHVALVTGAGSGIGRGIALRLAQGGARVACCDINVDAARATLASIEQMCASGSADSRSIALRMDVTSAEEVAEAFAQTKRDLGNVSISVVNAGIQHIDALVDLSFENWRRVTSVHLDGAFLCTKESMLQMRESGRGGSIIFIGSVHSKLASLLKAPYVSAKHGILGLCRAVAKEGAAHGIRSNVICPGFVRTPLVDKQIPEQAKTLGISEEEVVKKVMLKDTVDGEFTTVEDIAEVAHFLAGFKTNALTGQSIIASHGWCME